MMNSRMKQFEGTCDGGADSLAAGFQAAAWFVKNDGSAAHTVTIGSETVTVRPGEGIPIFMGAGTISINGASGGYRVTAYERADACPDERQKDTSTDQIADSAVTTAKLADDSVTKDKIAADVAGSGLGQNADGSLEVKVDDTTVEVNADTMRVKDGGISEAKLASASVNSAKLVNAVNGTGAPVATKPAVQVDYPLETTSGTSTSGVVTDRKYEVAGLDLWKTSGASGNGGDTLDVQVDGVSILTAVKNLNGTTEHSTITGMTIDRTKRIIPQGSTLRLSGVNGGAGGDCAVRGFVRLVPVA